MNDSKSVDSYGVYINVFKRITLSDNEHSSFFLRVNKKPIKKGIAGLKVK